MRLLEVKLPISLGYKSGHGELFLGKTLSDELRENPLQLSQNQPETGFELATF